MVGIETDRGPWVQALIAAGYQVFAINPLQAARYRERHSVSGAKSDAGDAHVLADMVRTDSHQLRPVAGDSDAGRGDQGRRPGAQDPDLGTHPAPAAAAPRAARVLPRRAGGLRRPRPPPTRWSCSSAAPDPDRAARLTRPRSPRRCGGPAAATSRPEGRADPGRAARRAPAPARRELVAAYAATVRAQVALITTLNTQISDPARSRSRPILASTRTLRSTSASPASGVLGARVLAEFGDDPDRYADAKARKNYAGTSPITRHSGKKKIVLARYVHNDRLVDALRPQAFAALTRLTRRPRLLRPAPRPRHRPPRRPAPARQPPRRHPPRLPRTAPSTTKTTPGPARHQTHRKRDRPAGPSPGPSHPGDVRNGRWSARSAARTNDLAARRSSSTLKLPGSATA